MNEFGFCEICGEPATCMVNDMFRWGNYDTGWVEFSVKSSHRFCEEHNRPSEEFDISLSPIAWSKLTKEEKKNYGK